MVAHNRCHMFSTRTNINSRNHSITLTPHQPTSKSRNLILVRHCQATGQHPDAALSETGHQQAQSLATFLSDYAIDHITTSQYLRAQQTIQPFANQHGLPIHTDLRLNERALSAEPLENWQQIVHDSFADPNLRAPGGESANEVLHRVRSALADILNQNHNLPLIVTHGNLLAILLHSVNPTFGYQGWQSLTNPDVFTLKQTGPTQFAFERLWRM